MNKILTDDELVNEIYKYVGEHIVFEDYTILDITTYIQGNYIYNVIKYTKDNTICFKKVKAKWKESE